LQSDGCKITTVEGLANGDQLHPLQQAFLDAGGLQCGYCTPGFLMSSFALLAENQNPSEAEVRRALNGHLCRCTGYSQIVESVLKAAETLRGN
jgi:carbon-monoxide dehydrogenase small subunit